MRILIISDVHANPWALNAVFEDAGPVNQILCAGDVVNYGPDPANAIAMIRTSEAIVVCGNHDHAVRSNADPRASPKKAALAIAMCGWTRSQIGDDDLLWLTTLSRSAIWEAQETMFAMFHATPVDPLYDYRLTPIANNEVVGQLLGNLASDVLVVGHTHLPLVRHCRNIQIINPGSVGQPLDRDPRAAYAIWDDGTVQLRRVAYDRTPVLAAIEELPLDRQFRDGLQSILQNARA